MKTLKSITALIIVTALTFIGGCSDEIISPLSQGSNSEINKTVILTDTKSASVDRVHSTISLKPGQSYTYSFENTGYYTFNSISVLNCPEKKNGVEITGYSDDEAFILGCNSSGLNVQTILVVNLTTSAVNLDVFLTGSKTKRVTHFPKVERDF